MTHDTSEETLALALSSLACLRADAYIATLQFTFDHPALRPLSVQTDYNLVFALQYRLLAKATASTVFAHVGKQISSIQAYNHLITACRVLFESTPKAQIPKLVYLKLQGDPWAGQKMLDYAQQILTMINACRPLIPGLCIVIDKLLEITPERITGDNLKDYLWYIIRAVCKESEGAEDLVISHYTTCAALAINDTWATLRSHCVDVEPDARDVINRYVSKRVGDHLIRTLNA